MSIRWTPILSVLVTILVISNIIFAVFTFKQKTSDVRFVAQTPQTTNTAPTVSPITTTNPSLAPDRTTTDFETLTEDASPITHDTKEVFAQKCKGIIKTIQPAAGGYLADKTSVSYCIGANELTFTDTTGKETVISSSMSTSMNDAPVLLDVSSVSVFKPGSDEAISGQGTYLIEYGVFGCVFSEDDCGVGMASNNVTFAFDMVKHTARALKNYPSWGNPLWNQSGTKAILQVTQIGGAGCSNESIKGYDLTTDLQKTLTTETGCPFSDHANATDVNGDPVPEWGPTFWTSDTDFKSILLGTDKVWKVIQKTF